MTPADPVEERLRAAADDAGAVPRRVLVLPRAPVDGGRRRRWGWRRVGRWALTALGAVLAGAAVRVAGRRREHDEPDYHAGHRRDVPEGEPMGGGGHAPVDDPTR